MSLLKISTFLMFSIFILSCSKDNIAPTILLAKPLSDVTIQRGEKFELDLTVTDDEELKLIRLLLGNNLQEFIQFDSKTSHTIKSDVLIPEDSPLGTFDIIIEAFDKRDNKAEKSFKVTVIE